MHNLFEEKNDQQIAHLNEFFNEFGDELNILECRDKLIIQVFLYLKLTYIVAVSKVSQVEVFDYKEGKNEELNSLNKEIRTISKVVNKKNSLINFMYCSIDEKVKVFGWGMKGKKGKKGGGNGGKNRVKKAINFSFLYH